MEIQLFKVSQSFLINQCYLFHQNNSGVLIDPAWDFDLINNFIVENKITIKAILITHAHEDHVNLVYKFSKLYNTPVYISYREMEYYNFHCYNLHTVNHLVNIKIENFNILPILTPGHTAGSMCYLIEGNVFSGDTVFIEGVGLCNCLGSNVDAMYDSIQFLKEYLPLQTKFWPGHSFGDDPGKDLEYILHNNIYFQLDRKYFTEFRMREKQSGLFNFY